jgi:hypothetical protein
MSRLRRHTPSVGCDAVEVLGSVLDVLFPTRCVGCGELPAALCPACLTRARPIPAGPGPG